MATTKTPFFLPHLTAGWPFLQFLTPIPCPAEPQPPLPPPPLFLVYQNMLDKLETNHLSKMYNLWLHLSWQFVICFVCKAHIIMPLVSTFSGSMVIKLFLKMSNYFANNLFQMLKFQRKLQNTQKYKKMMETQELLAACQFTIVEQVSNNWQHFSIL